MATPAQTTAALTRRTKAELAGEILALRRQLKKLKAESAEARNVPAKEGLARFPEENPAPVLRTNLAGTVLYANRPARTALGLKAGPEYGRLKGDLAKALRARKQGKRLPKVLEVALGKKIFAFTLVHVGKKGYVNIFGHDLTAERKAQRERQAALAESDVAQAQLIDAIENISDAFVAYDADGRLVVCNNTFRKMYGYSKDEARPGVHHTKLGRLDVERENVGGGRAYLKEKIEYRKKLKGSLVVQLADGRWIETRDRPTPKGGFVSIQTDITERRRAEKELAEKEAHLRTALANMSDGIFVLDADLRIVMFNDLYPDLLEIKANQIRVGQRANDLILSLAKVGYYGPGDPKRLTKDRLAILADKKRNEIEMTTPSGRILYLRKRPLKSGGAVVMVTDVTEQKRSEKALKESQQRYEAITANVPGVVYRRIMHTDGRISYSYISPGVRELYALEPDDIIADSSVMLAMLHPDEREPFYKSLDESAKYMKTWNHEFRVITTLGEQKWIRGSSGIHKTEDGDIVWDGFLLDISERRQAEELLNAILGTIPNPVVVVRMSDGNLVYCNEPAAVSVNLAPGDMTGTNISGYYMDDEERREMVRRMKHTGRIDYQEVELKTADGNPIWATISMRPITFQGERAALSCWNDISEQKQAEKDLRQANEATAAAQALLLSVLERSPIGVAVSRPSGEIVFANRRLAEMVGHGGADLVGKNARGFYSRPKDRKALIERLEKDGQVRDLEVEFKRADKSRFWVLLSSQMMEYNGKPALVTWTYDITERLQAEQAQRDLLEAIPNPLVLSSAETNELLYVNTAAYETYGLVVGKPVVSAYKDPDKRRQLVESLVRDGRVDNFEAEISSANGQIEWVLMSARMMDFEGHRAVLVASQIITERKRAEERVRAAQNLLEDAIESIGEGVVICDADDRIVMCSNRYRASHPDSIAHLLEPGTKFVTLMRGLVACGYIKTRKGGKRKWVEKRMERHRDKSGVGEHQLGDGRWIQTMEYATREGGVMLVRTDITERKRAEEALLQSEARLREILESSPIGATIVRPDGSFEFGNSRMAEMAGVTNEQFLKMKARDLYMNPEDRDLINKRLLKEGRLRDVEALMQRADGTPYWILLSFEPTKLENNEDAFFGWVYDISKMKEAETALKAAKEQAEELSKSKSEFVAVVSHEVRTPMNGVIGMARLLLGTSINEEQRQFAEMIVRSGESLLTILNDLLDISKLDAGKLDLESIPFDLKQTLEDTISIMATRAGEKGLDLTVDIDDSLPPILKGDPNRLRQILMNLVSNAIKFTAKGNVAIEIAPKGKANGEIAVELSVADTGPGITKKIREKLFSPYTQASTDIARKYGGTGLGLVICKRLAEMMGGDITLKSTVGKGSTFRATVLFTVGDKEDLANIKSADHVAMSEISAMSPLHILLVEDNDINRQVAIGMLRKQGHQVDVANDGKEAVAAVETKDFDVILMDRHMPKMDGLEATQRIRAMKGLKGSLPVIGVTAAVNKQEVAACLEAGMNDVVTKPINPFSLSKALIDFSQGADTWSDAEGAMATPPAEAGDGEVVFDATKIDALRVDFDDEMIDGLIASFMSSVPENLEQLRDALKTENVKKAHRVAHDMKSNSQSIGLLALSAQCRDIELACKENRLEDARRVATDLDGVIDASCEALRQR